MLRIFKRTKKKEKSHGKVRHNRAAHFSEKQYKCKNTSDRKAHKEWKSRIAWKQHKEDILFIHYKPCVVLSQLRVDGLGGELNKSVQLNKSVSVLPFREALHAEPCHDWHYKKKKKERERQTAKWRKCKRTRELCITPQLEDTKAWLTGKQAVAFPLACMGWIPFSTKYLFRR